MQSSRLRRATATRGCNLRHKYVIRITRSTPVRAVLPGPAASRHMNAVHCKYNNCAARNGPYTFIALALHTFISTKHDEGHHEYGELPCKEALSKRAVYTPYPVNHTGLRTSACTERVETNELRRLKQ
jgi:hypothetical protein